MQERRLASRKPLMLPVRLQAKGMVRWAETLTQDLSTRGFRCAMSGEAWPVGTLVTFEIPLFPVQAPFTGVAHVAHVEQIRHSDQRSIGLRFSEVSPSALHELHLYLMEPQSGGGAPQAEGYGEG